MPEGAADHPGQLEQRLRAGERRRAQALGHLPLDDRVERHLAQRVGHRGDAGDDRRHREAVEDGRQHGDRPRPRRGDQHHPVRRRRCAAGSPAAVPAKLPSPAAAATAPSASVASQPSSKLACDEERREDRQEAAEPAQRRVGPQREDDVRADPPAAPAHAGSPRWSGRRPAARRWGRRRGGGSRTASTPAATKTAAVARSSQPKPSSGREPGRRGRRRPPRSTSPKTDSRALAEVSDMAGGSTRGTTAARSTLCDFDRTRTPSAAG